MIKKRLSEHTSLRCSLGAYRACKEGRAHTAFIFYSINELRLLKSLQTHVKLYESFVVEKLLQKNKMWVLFVRPKVVSSCTAGKSDSTVDILTCGSAGVRKSGQESDMMRSGV